MLFLNSFIIGFTATALPGAVQTTVLQTALGEKWRSGLRFSAGAAFMDGLLLLLAFAGVIQFIVAIGWLKLTLGVLYMLTLGATGLLKSMGKLRKAEGVVDKQTFWNGAILVFLHPPTILYFIGVAATIFTASSLPLTVVALCGVLIRRIGSTILLTIFYILTSLVLIGFAVKLLLSLL